MLKDILGTARAALAGRPQKLRMSGDIARNKKRWAQAATFYSEYLELQPDDAPIWVQYGHVSKESGQASAAENAYRQALLIRPDVADTLLHLGHVLKISGRMDEAAKVLGRALQIDPANVHVVAELNDLLHLGWHLPDDILRAMHFSSENGRQSPDDSGTALAGSFPPVEPDEDGALKPHIVFDVSDLIQYFMNARAPTGIQRVQIEIASALLRDASTIGDVGVCTFDQQQDRWVRIPDALFFKICALAVAGGDPQDAAWIVIVREIKGTVRHAGRMVFASGAVLVNLGTSWWLKNYFAKLQDAKAEYGLRYIPFVHDLIPVKAPEYCVPGLAEDFKIWISDVLRHADHFFTNSESTRADLLSSAQRAGQDLSPDDVTVVRLDADFRKSSGATLNPEHFQKWNLGAGGYVLFVSTIEPRKNHAAAFSAWRSLIEKHGAANVPKLVCAGKDGWLNNTVYAAVDESDILRSHIVMLPNLSDDDLALLYDHCLFTIYPSHYEGWGLPVTESLCHGKIPLVSASSSLLESGGKFADYFEAGSEPAMVQALERLIFDAQYRGAREDRIHAEFRPRRWTEIGAQIERIARLVAERPQSDAPAQSAIAVPYTHDRDRTTILVYSETTEQSVVAKLGDAEYSYYFVLKEFLPVLEKLGRVIVVKDPETDVDPVFHDAQRRGETCFFLSFSPPHRTPLHLACPTIPVFAWEFDSIPYETWFAERQQDWCYVLNRLGRAITHSAHSVEAVKAQLGADFPIASVPAPLWDRFESSYKAGSPAVAAETTLTISGNVIDTADAQTLFNNSIDRNKHSEVTLSGVIYLSIFNPHDGRKNISDLICAFCDAFRDTEDATLVLKLTHRNLVGPVFTLQGLLEKFMPFKCRVVLLAGYLDNEMYDRLVAGSSYGVNTSLGEGQCLPLMESMACGKPVVAPDHTGIADYVDESNAFIIQSSAEPACWPQDPRYAYLTLRRRIDFESVVTAYRDSYRVAKSDPERYAKMGASAHESLHRHSSQAVAAERLASFLSLPTRHAMPDETYGRIKTTNARWLAGVPGEARVLEYGGELDAIALALADAGAKVDAVHASRETFEAARALATERKIPLSLHRGDFGLKPAGVYDVILFGASYHHSVTDETVVSMLRNMLYPWGKILIACDPPEAPPAHRTPLKIRPGGKELLKPLPKWRRPEFQESELVSRFVKLGFAWQHYQVTLSGRAIPFYEFRIASDVPSI